MCFPPINNKKMRKYFNIFLLTLVALASVTMVSCKNETEEIFDQDAITRLANAKQYFTDILTDQGGKWKMEYYANGDEPGYVYVMTFRNNGSVTISGENKWISQLNPDGSTYGSETSLWDVITDNGPVLTFNSYNKYFHLFADPDDITDPEALDDSDTDETGIGHEGDYEFDLMKYSGDTLYMSGKKYGINVIMTRLDGSIDDREYMDQTVAQADSFFKKVIPQVYLNLPNGKRWVVKDGYTSILTMYPEGSDSITTAEKHNVIITLDGLSFMNPNTFDGYTVQFFDRQADGSLLCRNDHQTTITAGPLNKVFAIQSLTWKADTSQMGGAFKAKLHEIINKLSGYNSSKFLSLQMAYDSKANSYSIIFNIRSKVKGKQVPLTATFKVNYEMINDNQLKIKYTGEMDDNAHFYVDADQGNCPAIIELIELLGNTYTLSTSSLLAPTDMRFVEDGNASNTIYWRL